MSEDKQSPITYEKANEALESSLENVDFAVDSWLKEDMDIFANTNKGWKRVPIIWSTFERASHSKDKEEKADREGTLIYPMISVNRSSMSKQIGDRANPYADIPPSLDVKGGSIQILRRIKKDKTSQRINAQRARNKRLSAGPNFLLTRKPSERIVYEEIYIPMPVFVSVVYDIAIRTEYQQQVNQILQPFLTYVGQSNYFIISHEGHRYEAFYNGDIGLDTNITSFDDEERYYEASISLRVLAYIFTGTENERKPKRVRRETIADISFGVEFDGQEEDEKLLPVPDKPFSSNID